MTEITINAQIAAPETQQVRRKILALGFIRYQAQTQQHAETIRMADSMSVLGMMVVEEQIDKQDNQNLFFE